MQMLAQGYLAYEITGSGAILGVINLGIALPLLTVPLFGGALADKIDRKLLIQGAQMTAALLALALGLLVDANLISWQHLMVASMVQGALFSCYDARPPSNHPPARRPKPPHQRYGAQRRRHERHDYGSPRRSRLPIRLGRLMEPLLHHRRPQLHRSAADEPHQARRRSRAQKAHRYARRHLGRHNLHRPPPHTRRPAHSRLAHHHPGYALSLHPARVRGGHIPPASRLYGLAARHNGLGRDARRALRRRRRQKEPRPNANPIIPAIRHRLAAGGANPHLLRRRRHNDNPGNGRLRQNVSQPSPAHRALRQRVSRPRYEHLYAQLRLYAARHVPPPA